MSNLSVETPVPFEDLLKRAGIKVEVMRAAICAMGGNNRIYRVETTSGVFAAKQYFRHVGDQRDRLAAEYAFLSYSSIAAPGLTPRPLASNPESGMALYEFIEGRRFSPGEVNEQLVDAAASFFRALNSHLDADPPRLPIASEACFSIAGHLELIGDRIGRLGKAKAEFDAVPGAVGFLGRLESKWREISAAIRIAAVRSGLALEEPLAPEARCISPSDFGFHNALLEPSGTVRFIDFEYAGWDDPAKTAGDFFAQLAVPVPSKYFEKFVGLISREFSCDEGLATRARLLRPAYQVKWCCIALNVFLPVHMARRSFANPGLDESALKRAQLLKADQILNSIENTDYGLH